MFDIKSITRKNILDLKPYSSAREEYTGKDAVFLDANENPFNKKHNRYPDPLQIDLKNKISTLKKVVHTQLFLGNGSDEAIDLLFRAFCSPGKDNVIIPDPTYGMYQVCADINDIEVKNVSLTEDFQLDVKSIFKKVNKHTKLIFICTPNNPTSNTFKEEDVLEIIQNFQQGLVVVDEAYIDFAKTNGYVKYISEYKNLVVLQTFSKAWGLAGIRLGMAIADAEIIKILNSIKYPYNVNVLTQKAALDALNEEADKNLWVTLILKEKKKLEKSLQKFPFVGHIFPSDANFLLVKVAKPREIYDFLTNEKIIIRDRSKVHLCLNCLRITIGTEQENLLLLRALEKYAETK